MFPAMRVTFMKLSLPSLKVSAFFFCTMSLHAQTPAPRGGIDNSEPEPDSIAHPDVPRRKTLSFKFPFFRARHSCPDYFSPATFFSYNQACSMMVPRSEN